MGRFEASDSHIRLPYRVLMVVDNAGDAKQIVDCFYEDATKEQTRAIVQITTNSIPEAIAKLRINSFDAILLDLELKDTSELSVLDQIIKLNLTLPIIVMTGKDDEQLGILAVQKGAADYIVKNRINCDTVPRAVRYAIERSVRIATEIRLLEAESELQAAEQIQQRILNHRLPQIERLELAGMCLPAEKVGGDFYDFFDVDESSCLGLVADVSGHGLKAGFIAAQLSGLIRGLVYRQADLSEIAVSVNEYLEEYAEPQDFATMFLYWFDTHSRELSYISAGHPAWILKSNGKWTEIANGYPPLGVCFLESYAVSVCRLDPGDLLLIPSDGAFEAHNPRGEQFGIERLHAHLWEQRHQSLNTMAKSTIDQINGFREGRLVEDDCTLVLLRVRNH